jgi:hypothetical protein
MVKNVSHEDESSPAGPLITEVEKVDSVLLDTLGQGGSMTVGALSLAGVGLALGGVVGVVVGTVAGVGLGALGAVGRNRSHSR